LLEFFRFFNRIFGKLNEVVMAFTLDREAAARRLGVSTRTIDRHIQSGRIKSRRVGKKIFLEEDDVESLRMEDTARSEEDYIVVLSEESLEPEITTKAKAEIVPKNSTNLALAEFSRIYNDAQTAIAQKDEIIQDLSYKLGKAETELGNSINLNEHKKTTYMYETLKNQQAEKTREYSSRLQDLETELQKRNSALIGVIILLILVIVAALIFLFFDHLF